MANQPELTAGARHFYDQLQRDDRNLRLSNGTGLVDHHFGIGPALISVAQASQAEIAATIRELEVNQVTHLTDRMGAVVPGHRVLDAGCGRGGTDFRLVQKFACRVDGITVAPYQAQFASAVALEHDWDQRTDFLVMDMTRLGFAPGIFNHVITNETTMYILDLPALFGEFRRVLKPGGRYTLATWCINANFTGENSYIEPINRHYGVHMHTDQEYEQALTEAGFEIVVNDDLTTEAIPHWEIRSQWDQASGVEPYFLAGHTSGAILYKMLSAVVK